MGHVAPRGAPSTARRARDRGSDEGHGGRARAARRPGERGGATFIDTPLTRPFFEDPEFAEFVNGMIAMKRLGTPDEVAAAVLYLASPASGIVTGTSLRVDGGWTAH